MDDHNAPATKGDIQDLEARLEGKLDALETRFDGKLDALEARLEGKLDVVEQRMRDHVQEAVREGETRLLNAFYSFAQTNQTRLTEAEREAAAIKDRLAIVEGRITEVEKRLNFPPAA